MTNVAPRGFLVTIRLGFAPNRRTLTIQKGEGLPNDNYEVARAAQVIAYFALRAPKRCLNILKAMKLVYLADRESLGRHGEPILEEPRHSLPKGPVNLKTFTLAGKSAGLPAEWTRFLYPRDEHHDLTVRGNVQFSHLDELSEGDLEILDAVWHKFGWMDEHVLVAWTHKPENLPEWTDPKGGRLPITLESMMTALALPDAARRAHDAGSRQSLRSLLGAGQ